MRPLLAFAAAACLALPGIAEGARASLVRAKPHHLQIRVTTVSGAPANFRAYATRGAVLRVARDVRAGALAAWLGAPREVPRFGGRATTPAEFFGEPVAGEIVFEAIDRSAPIRVEVVPADRSSGAREVGRTGTVVVVRRSGPFVAIETR